MSVLWKGLLFAFCIVVAQSPNLTLPIKLFTCCFPLPSVLRLEQRVSPCGGDTYSLITGGDLK